MLLKRDKGKALQLSLIDFSSESEYEEPPSRAMPTTDEFFNRQALFEVVLPAQPDLGSYMSSDEDGSVVEDNQIDHMTSGTRKRQLKLKDMVGNVAKKSKTGPKQRQPKPAGLSKPRIAFAPKTPGTAGSVSKTSRHVDKKSKTKGVSSKPNNSHSRGTQPKIQVGIRDVIQPNAPRFLRIAARAASKRSNQGRSSPTGKIINLAARRDHIDAATVLSEWKNGMISQRPSVSVIATKNLDYNPPKKPGRRERFNQQLEDSSMVRQSPARRTGNAEESSSAFPGHPSLHSRSAGTSLPNEMPPDRQILRPAVLEINEANQRGTFAFMAKKRKLDHQYSKQRGVASVPSSVGFESGEPDLDLLVQYAQRDSSPVRGVPRDEPVIARRARKQTKPREINTEAREFAHAHDPLPSQPICQYEQLFLKAGADSAKLLGLGPYGTQYTHHFDIFPFEAGVFFHSSTLLGSGIMDEISELVLAQYIQVNKAPSTYMLGEQILRWGQWDAQVSSELGIVVDFVTAQLVQHISRGGDDDVGQEQILDAATFVLKYMKSSLAMRQEEDMKACIARVLEVIGSFEKRLQQNIPNAVRLSISSNKLIAKVCDKFLLVLYLFWHLCGTSSSLFAEQMKLEKVMLDLAKTIVSILLKLERSFRNSCNELAINSVREQGIKEDKAAIHSWTLLLKVLDTASIPRSSFWEVLSSVIIRPSFSSLVTVSEFEHIWRTVFSLLPLTEFTNSGALSSGRRHDFITEGWLIPQQLLKRIFDIYRGDSRQDAGFNAYTRSLIVRCHHLVHCWGWKKCVSVVGVIFDFFGSQGLAHLRNEQTYQSPQFLEQLAGNPCLDIRSEDRTFHVFLKLLALSLQKLSEDGMSKDVRNLVARTMPNHDRQYLKDQDIHERDLAALRNHHDLLVTLYWAAMPEHRPNPALLERLVVPANSHKEACLINIRAWSQLARFVVASGDASELFKPFRDWRHSFFSQVLQQYDSVASDVQQQFLSLPGHDRQFVTQDIRQSMVKANKLVIADVLHLSVVISRDVMEHTPDLAAASHAFDHRQLKAIFRHFTVVPAELGWSTLRAAMQTLDIFMTRIDDGKQDGDSQQSESQLMNNLAQVDDALMHIDRDVVSDFFSMARALLSDQLLPIDVPSDYLVSAQNLSMMNQQQIRECQTLMVHISAKIGWKFFQGGSIQLSAMFEGGKYGLFDKMPHSMSLIQRKWLVLFVKLLLGNQGGRRMFKETGLALHVMWALTIVKPQCALSFELELAKALHENKGLPASQVGYEDCNAYDRGRRWFEYAIRSIRKRVRDTPPMQQKNVKARFSDLMDWVQYQIQRDLLSLRFNRPYHTAYTQFVHQIISLIRAEGSEFCQIDDFFFKVSEDYSPPTEDPELQVATTLSYGVRLREGDQGAGKQLFYFLLNNLKKAFVNDTLEQEAVRLSVAMKDRTIHQFMVGVFMPAIMAGSRGPGARNPRINLYPLISFYKEALEQSACPMLYTYHLALSKFQDEDAVFAVPSREELASWVMLMNVLPDISSDVLRTAVLGSAYIPGIRFGIMVMDTLKLAWQFIYSCVLSGEDNEMFTMLRRQARILLAALVSSFRARPDPQAFVNAYHLVVNPSVRDMSLLDTFVQQAKQLDLKIERVLGLLGDLQYPRGGLVDEETAKVKKLNPDFEFAQNELVRDIALNWEYDYADTRRVMVKTPGHSARREAEGFQQAKRWYSSREDNDESAQYILCYRARLLEWLHHYGLCFVDGYVEEEEEPEIIPMSPF